MDNISNGLKNFRLMLGMAAFAFVLVGALAVSTQPAHAQFDDFGGFGDFGSSDFGGDFGGDLGGDFTGGDWTGWGGYDDVGACDYGCGGYTDGDWTGWGGYGDYGDCAYGCGDDYSDSYGDDYGDNDCYDSCDSGYGDDYSSNECGYDCSNAGSSNSGYSSSGYSSSGYSIPSYSTPSYYSDSYYYPSYPSQSGDTCVNGSCNTTTNINTNIHDSFNNIVYRDRENEYDYDICRNLPGMQGGVPQGYYEQGGNCFYQQYDHTPYVSLSAVPYTGLELGPVGTALYWGFLVLWCAVAAYLIAVKKVQNKLVSGMSAFLFPQTASASRGASHEAPVAQSETTVAREEGVDPFIASQLNKYR
jgi:hypothetical protein